MTLLEREVVSCQARAGARQTPGKGAALVGGGWSGSEGPREQRPRAMLSSWETNPRLNQAPVEVMEGFQFFKKLFIFIFNLLLFLPVCTRGVLPQLPVAADE